MKNWARSNPFWGRFSRKQRDTAGHTPDLRTGSWMRGVVGIGMVVAGASAWVGISASVADPTGPVVAHTASVQDDPHRLVGSLTEALLRQLQAHLAELPENPQLVYGFLKNLLLPYADFREMSRRVLTTEWVRLTAAEQQAFVSAFQTLVLRTYAGVFAQYKGQTVQLLEMRPQDWQQNRAQVRSVVQQPETPPVAVDYRLIEHNGKWFVYDLSIDGISLVASYRGQFRDAIQNKGFAAVLAELQARNAAGLEPMPGSGGP